MKRITTDWNNIEHNGSVRTLIFRTEEMPVDGEMVWSIDSGERVVAEVVDIQPSKSCWAVALIRLRPDWATQEDDPDGPE